MNLKKEKNRDLRFNYSNLEFIVVWLYFYFALDKHYNNGIRSNTIFGLYNLNTQRENKPRPKISIFEDERKQLETFSLNFSRFYPFSSWSSAGKVLIACYQFL